MVTAPPKITDGTAPSRLAATPDSKAPISLDEPMKIWFTAETRPSISGGRIACSSVLRINTLTMSAAPLTASSTSDSQNQRDSAKTIMQSPNAATANRNVRPARRAAAAGRATTDISTAPTAGAARSTPEPLGAHVQDLLGEDRQHRHRAAEQHREQVEGHRADEDPPAHEEGEPGPHAGQDRLLPRGNRWLGARIRLTVPSAVAINTAATVYEAVGPITP